MVLLAGLAVVILVLSEIMAIAPSTQAKRLRALSLWCAVPALVLFAVAWLVQIQRMFDQAP